MNAIESRDRELVLPGTDAAGVMAMVRINGARSDGSLKHGVEFATARESS